MEHNNPMEPHATHRACGGRRPLTLYDSNQGAPVRATTWPRCFGLDPEQVRVVSPHVGGGFGSKAFAARRPRAGRWPRGWSAAPVKLALTRQQMFALVGYRTPTIQRVRLGADADGRLTAISHEVVEQTSRIKEFAEQTATPHPDDVRRPSTGARRTGWPRSTSRRRRGCGRRARRPGMFALESAMDELAVALRHRPGRAADPQRAGRSTPSSGVPWSSRHLVACLREGAERFGWAGRDPRPRTRREGRWLVGTGVAASTYPTRAPPGAVPRSPSTADGRYTVRIGAADIGTGAWTALTQIAADALGVPVERVELRIGDSRAADGRRSPAARPGSPRWGSAIVLAARDAAAPAGRRSGGRSRPTAVTVDGGDGRTDAARETLRDARLRRPVRRGAGRRGHRRGAGAADARGVRRGPDRQPDDRPLAAHRRHDAWGCRWPCTRRRVARPRGSAHVVNHDLAEYHVAANADVGDLEVAWLDEDDPHANPMGVKGIGEIGIVGTAAAVANAVYHATGMRVRDLPITPDKYFRELGLT